MEEQNKTETQKRIEQKFKTLLHRANTDPQLETEVFSTIGRMEAAAELLDFFTVKFVQTEGELLNQLNTKQ